MEMRCFHYENVNKQKILSLWSTETRRCNIILDLVFDFERVLKLQQLLYFHRRTQARPCAERGPEFKGALFSYNHLSFFSDTKD